MQYIILDTHVYRKIGRYIATYISSEEELNLFYENWKKNENVYAYEGCLSLIVLMELLSHLQNKNDPAFEDCKNAIKVLARHSPNYFVPPPTLYFSRKFFDFEPQIFDNFYSRIYDIIRMIAISEPPYSNEIESSIIEVSVILEKQEHLMLNAIRQGVSISNDNGDNSILFKERTLKNKINKQKLRSNLKNLPNYIKFQANNFFQMLLAFVGIDNFESISDFKRTEIIEYLTNNHPLPFLLMREINENLLQPHYNFGNKTNELTDILVSFAANKNENRFLVTAEKKIIRNGINVVIDESVYLQKMQMSNVNQR